MAENANLPTDKVELENVRLIFRNFEGREDAFNPRGQRSTKVVLTPEQYQQLAALGYNVKLKESRFEDQDPQPQIEVFLRFDIMPPNVWQVTSRGKTLLNANNIAVLDTANILNVDMIIRPYDWESPQGTGRKAMLADIWVTIEESRFDLKYADLPAQ